MATSPNVVACPDCHAAGTRAARRVPALALAAMALAALVITACSSSTAAPVVTALPPATIIIRNYAYVPDQLSVRVGTVVTVRNTDKVVHTVSADDGSFDTGLVGGGDTATFVVHAIGRHTYHCTVHPYMTGTLIVTG